MEPRIRALVGRASSLLAKLDSAEKSALKGQLPLTFKREISAEHERKLAQLGLVERKLGGLALTPVGRIAAGMLPTYL